MVTSKNIAFVLVALLSACVGNVQGRGDDQGGDGAAPSDSSNATDRGQVAEDSGAIADLAPLPADPTIDLVVDHISLPKSADDFSIDLDGDGKKDNQFGLILGAVDAFQPGQLQKSVDDSLAEGGFLLLFRLFANSLLNTNNAKILVFEGDDGDSDPANNLQLNTKIRIAADSAQNFELRGHIIESKLTAYGDLLTVIPSSSGPPTKVTLKNAAVTATLSESTLTTGKITGGIPWTEIENNLLPSLAAQLNTPAIDQKIRDALDTNGNGTIEASDLMSNLLIGALFTPDLDLNGDGTDDAMSIAFGFTAIRCQILP